MNNKAYSLILKKQLLSKWGRTLLASMGIAVGVWAITLSTGLSEGVKNAVVTAINSQPFAKQIQINRISEKQKIDFFSEKSPDFLPQSFGQFDELLKDSRVDRVQPEVSLPVNLFPTAGEVQCQEQAIATARVAETESMAPVKNKNCNNISVQRSEPKNFYEKNKNDWIGEKIENFGENGIAVCTKCVQPLLATLGVSKPEDIIGKQIVVEPTSGGKYYKAGQKLSFSRDSQDPVDSSSTYLKEPLRYTFVVKAVIKSHESDIFGGSPVYIPARVFQEAFTNANPGKDFSQYGVFAGQVIVKSYDDLRGVVHYLEDNKYIAFAPALMLIDSISAVFTGLQVVLFIFGFIIIIAAMFGIINIMIISVLERKKEIGVLKSLGATNGSIFRLFLTESTLLGFFGWLLGTIGGILTGYAITAGLKAILTSMPDIKKNLEGLNIDSIYPAYPWQVLLATLLVVVIITALAGISPSLRAAKQDPAEVMRSE